MAEFFGFEIKRKSAAIEKPAVSFVPKTDEDGAGVIQAGGHFGAYLDIDGDKAKSEIDLILKYRDIAAQPECDAAVEDIVNESIVGNHDGAPLNLILDEVDTSNKIKKSVQAEFTKILQLLNFNSYAHDIYRRWYVDGRLPYHIIIDQNNPKAGIKELRYIDPTKLRKVKEVEEKDDPKTGAKVIVKQKEYYMFQDNAMGKYNQGLKIHPDSIAYATSGVMDQSRKRIMSYLQKAIKPVNQLRMMEDSLVIYRLARAPERRMFYIDVGNLPRGKAEQYMKDIMAKYRNKLVYDAKTGEIRDDRKHMSMLEDFWLPRREGGRGTEISTLPGGENLGQIEDIIYFQKRLYRSLNVPMNRLEQEQQFSLGRATEISRDELKFQKFIDRLRNRFANLFYDILKKQLILKNVITEDDWNSWKNKVTIDFLRDNHFAELKEAELLRERIQSLDQITNYVGEYFSKEWVQKNVLLFDDETIDNMNKEIAGAQQQPDDDQGVV